MSNEFNLDAVVDSVDVSPASVTLQGNTFTVRRDLTGPEILRYWQFVQEGDDVAALSILVGSADGPRLNSLVEALPQKRMVLVIRKVMDIAGLTDAEQAGE